MKGLLTYLFLIIPFLGTIGQSGFYDFTVNSLDGNEYPFSDLKGKKVMIVNTASKCGLTPQYEQLQAVYEKYGGDDFIILGFPANNFKNQEPGTADEIREFCDVNYGVSFPMMEKISVKGEDQHPLYQWLTQKEKNGLKDSEVQWNFQKYLINESGELEKVVPPKVKPDDEEIINWISEN